MTKDTAAPLLIRALNREQVERTPVWFMRQAGRHLPEYRELRKQIPSFVRFIRTPKMTTEAALQPLRRYPLDAAILFSDILTIPEALGLGLHFQQDHGPAFERPLDDPADSTRWQWDQLDERLEYVEEATADLHAALQREFPGMPLIGFCGAPWTLLSYMVASQHDRLIEARAWVMRNPQTSQSILLDLAEAAAHLLARQVKAGATAVQVFDTWGGELSAADFRATSLVPLQRLVDTFRKLCGQQHIPVILFSRTSGNYLEALCSTGCDAVSLDWRCDIALAKAQVSGQVALQGNLDPAALLTDEKTIRKAVERILTRYGENRGHIFNLGHGIPPQADPALVSLVARLVSESTIHS